MNIAIDLDGTIDKIGCTAMRAIVAVLKLAGNDSFLVTSRHDCDRQVVDDWANMIGVPRTRVICTNGTAKKWFCEQRGLKIDVWIDDDPASILNGK